MRALLVFSVIGIVLSALPAQAQTACSTSSPSGKCPSATCSTLGQTEMSQDQKNIVSCLYNNSNALVWKSTLGGGTANYVAEWNGPSSLSTGTLWDNGSSVGIGTTSPNQNSKLDVNGDIAVAGTDVIRRDGANAYLFPWSTGYSNNNVYVGGGSTTNLIVSGNMTSNNSIYASSYYRNSDLRLKKNVKVIDHALDRIMNVEGVSYTWIKNGKPDDGLIAQNVEKEFPELVFTDAHGMKSVEYNGLIGPMLESIHALRKENEQLQERMTALENEMKKISAP